MLKGIIPYLVSPVSEDGHIISDSLEHLCSDLADKGAAGLCALGSVGEFPYLSSCQKDEIVSIVARSAHKKGIPAVAGVAGFSEQQAVEEALRFRDLGADGIVLMMEAYFPLSIDMQEHFIRAVSKAVPDVEIVIYTNPKYMHYTLSLDLFARIEDCGNVRYIKDASGNTGYLLSLSNRFGSRYGIFSASAHIPLFVFMLGGLGWMAGPACIIPKMAVRLYDLFISGKLDEAMALQRRLWAVNNAFARYDLVPCIKAVLNHQGYEVGNPIAPLKPLEGEDAGKLFRIIDELQEVT